MATELDWLVRETLWSVVPKAREEIIEWEGIEHRSAEFFLAAQNGGELGVGEWDEMEFGKRAVVPAGTLIPLILYRSVLEPELEGKQSKTVLLGCAEFIERVLDEYPELGYLIADVADYFEVSRKSWEVFRDCAGPLLRQLMSAEGLP